MPSREQPHAPDGPAVEQAGHISYTPSAEFYTEPCSDASNRINLDVGALGMVVLHPGDLANFVVAMQSRLDDCRTDRRFYLGYLNILEVDGRNEMHNHALADFETQFPGQSHPDPLPD